MLIFVTLNQKEKVQISEKLEKLSSLYSSSNNKKIKKDVAIVKHMLCEYYDPRDTRELKPYNYIFECILDNSNTSDDFFMLVTELYNLTIVG